MPNDGQLAGSRILVIEDDFLVGEIILLMLEDEGAQVLGPVGRSTRRSPSLLSRLKCRIA